MLNRGLTIGMKGFYKLQTRNKFSGKITQSTDWFPNLLLDAGRNQMGISNFMTHCQVGTDGTAPNAGQAGLIGYHAGSSNIVSDVTGNQVTVAPYYAYRRKVWRFNPGTVAATLPEVGVGWGLSGSTLISRALILDPVLQTSTTITPLVDEFLEMLYELRYYPPTTDVVGPQVTLNGIVYNTLTRAAEVNSQYWADYIGSKIGVLGSQWMSYDGAIGTQLQNPSGLAHELQTYALTNAAYVGNSYEVIMSCPVSYASWNLAAGIRSIRIRTTAGSFQTQFTAVGAGNTIPKTASNQMMMKWKLAWAAL